MNGIIDVVVVLAVLCGLLTELVMDSNARLVE